MWKAKRCVSFSRRQLEIEKAVEFAAQSASGLAVAHKAGVVHRDIKPENLVVTTSRQIKILILVLPNWFKRSKALVQSVN